MFNKRLDELTITDVAGLRGTPEGQVFEIKSDLRPAKPGERDPWLNTPPPGADRRGPGDYAKFNVFKEIVAFANSEGGWLVLGMEELGPRPSVAGTIVKLPDCRALADRFARAAYDWIDPPIPGLLFRGLEAPQDSAGIVVSRVPRSPLAPHRLRKTDHPYEAYRRIGEESKPMSMREIQDMVLERVRGNEWIHNAFVDARARYVQHRPSRTGKNNWFGFQVIVVPVGARLAVDRPYLHQHLFHRNDQFVGRFGGRAPLTIHTMEYEAASISKGVVQPILRGGRRQWRASYPEVPGREHVFEDFGAVEVLGSGVVTVWTKTTHPDGLNVRWILADCANALLISDLARSLGGSPDQEYAMDVEIRADYVGAGDQVLHHRTDIPFGLLPDETHFPHKIEGGLLSLPRYSVGTRAAFPAVLGNVLDDICNAVHRPTVDDFQFDPL